MIRYDFVCARGHAFQAWFSDAASCDDQLAKGAVDCPTCGRSDVRKALMAPALVGGAAPPADGEAAGHRALRAAFKGWREAVMARTEDVGGDFPRQARKMHAGEIEERPIRGEATAREARDLVEDGVPVMPLPPAPDGGN
ncbi:MAG: DUF1178 family protein [Hyphomicrobiales bacterium]|nr:DUF1178 family protein [Hyphomicrobiales bacterium]MDE2016196.1 DUF1178 family protein [Hyphomicrobiales bacterium]